jgi:hypothetical protein
VILHYVTQGPKRTHPQPPIKQILGGPGGNGREAPVLRDKTDVPQYRKET